MEIAREFKRIMREIQILYPHLKWNIFYDEQDGYLFFGARLHQDEDEIYSYPLLYKRYSDKILYSKGGFRIEGYVDTYIFLSLLTKEEVYDTPYRKLADQVCMKLIK